MRGFIRRSADSSAWMCNAAVMLPLGVLPGMLLRSLPEKRDISERRLADAVEGQTACICSEVKERATAIGQIGLRDLDGQAVGDQNKHFGPERPRGKGEIDQQGEQKKSDDVADLVVYIPGNREGVAGRCQE